MRCDICIRCVDRRLQSGRISEHKVTLSLWCYWNRMLLGVWLPVHACFLWQTINKIFCSSIVPDPLLDNLAAAERIESELTCSVETRGLYGSFQGEFMSVNGGRSVLVKKTQKQNKNSAAEFCFKPEGFPVRVLRDLQDVPELWQHKSAKHRQLSNAY